MPGRITDSPGEAIQEIVEYVPGGLLRWGILALAATLFLMLSVAWFVSYPKVVRGRFSLTTLTPPARVVSPVNAEVQRIFVEDGDRVDPGTALVVFRSPTRYEDVVAIGARLDSIAQAVALGEPLPPVDTHLALGNLQAAYAPVLQRLSDYRSLDDEKRFYDEKSRELAEQIDSHAQLAAILRAQQELLDEELRLAQKDLDRQRQLHEEGLVAATDLEAAQKVLLQRRLEEQSGRAALSRSRIELSEFRKADLDLQRTRSDERRTRAIELGNAIQTLRTAIADWETKYVLRAPIGGHVSFFRELHEAQHVSAFEPVVAVLPDSTQIVGKVRLDQRDAGRVRPGQRVILRFDSFPFREYGTVSGVVERVSRLGMAAENDRLLYLLDVRLPRGLRTSYGRSLSFRQELRGDADIVTAERRLIQRFFDQLRLTE